MYLSYEEYKGFGGTLTETEFDRFSFRAESELNNLTFDRVSTLLPVPECVKRCLFELITYISKTSKNGNSASVASVSNDGYSVSYAEPKSSQKEIYSIVYTYLANTGLMYRGTEKIEGYNFVEPIPDGTAYLLVKTE